METTVKQITHAVEIAITDGPHAGQVVRVPFDHADDAETVAEAIPQIVRTLACVQHIDALNDAAELYLTTPGLDGTEKVEAAGRLMAAVLELLHVVGLDACKLGSR